jgi:hypothetical protein
MAEDLYAQATATAAAVTQNALPASVVAIRLPEAGLWTPVTPALPGTPGTDRPALDTQVSALQTDDGTPSGTPHAAGPGTPAHPTAQAVTLDDLAAAAGVPVPRPGEQLTDQQIRVVLQHLRSGGDPPRSYRRARTSFRQAGFVGGEGRVSRAWSALQTTEETGETPGNTGSGPGPGGTAT